MYLSIDVGYKNDRALAIGLGFSEISSQKEDFLIQSETLINSEYIPGEFYKKELPPILDLLKKNSHFLQLIFIDGYVWLGEKKGLGAHLYDSLNPKIPVVGIAKTEFKFANSNSIQVFRKESKRPLFISSIGVELEEAGNLVRSMYGKYRIPELIKRTDRLTKGG
ncbi:MAG: endonuclease V [Leptospiraceae bacterium]|nr:endonuclease V [Leptospiraceae bacterium]